tara:strand:+ start:12046 stop:12600 length:555 start_codon:yes stop_codon:yes gene_type:complete
MAFKLNGNPLAVDVPFTVGTGEDAVNYPANWLRLSTAEEKTALGITEVEDSKVYDSRFYNGDGSAKTLTDTNATDENGDPVLDENGDQVVILGVKSLLKAQEKQIAKSLLNKYDWQVVRKAEKGTAMDSAVITYRDGIRTAYTTRKTEIENCADTAALVTLYGTTEKDGEVTPNMTQYPTDPNL